MLYVLAEKVNCLFLKKKKKNFLTTFYSGVNQSTALVKAGGQVYHAGNFGNDAVWIRDLMKDIGIDMSYANIKENEVKSPKVKMMTFLLNF